MLFHPLLIGGVLRSLVSPPRTLSRPAVLDGISRVPRPRAARTAA